MASRYESGEARLGSHESARDSFAVRTPLRWKANLALFLATVVSVFFTGADYARKIPPHPSLADVARALPLGYAYAVPLLSILLTHEFGHYIAARAHRVDASLPFFLPLPFLSPFGTMGAVIAMRGRIRSRNALLDIGASGPLAGLCVAVPVLAYGLAHSQVAPIGPHASQEGQSLLYLAMKRVILGPIPDGYDVFLNPVAWAGWAGLFITALNLIPVGQLDGGHVAYALFTERQNRYARWIHRACWIAFLYNVARFVVPVVRLRAWDHLFTAVMNSTFWLVLYFLLRVLMRFSGRDHPPTERGELSPLRRGLAILSLVLFVLLFMPTPLAQYD